jgi:hypothetical protein
MCTKSRPCRNDCGTRRPARSEQDLDAGLGHPQSLQQLGQLWSSRSARSPPMIGRCISHRLLIPACWAIRVELGHPRISQDLPAPPGSTLPDDQFGLDNRPRPGEVSPSMAEQQLDAEPPHRGEVLPDGRHGGGRKLPRARRRSLRPGRRPARGHARGTRATDPGPSGRSREDSVDRAPRACA